MIHIMSNVLSYIHSLEDIPEKLRAFVSSRFIEISLRIFGEVSRLCILVTTCKFLCTFLFVLVFSIVNNLSNFFSNKRSSVCAYIS